MYKLYFDGASKLNPGESGCGWCIYEDEKIIAKGCLYLGKMTNNQAEYSGLINGLNEAIKLNIENIEIYGDSLLVIEQMKGNYKVKSSNLIKLWENANNLVKNMKVNYNWIDRKYNKIADELANEAILKKNKP